MRVRPCSILVDETTVAKHSWPLCHHPVRPDERAPGRTMSASAISNPQRMQWADGPVHPAEHGKYYHVHRDDNDQDLPRRKVYLPRRSATGACCQMPSEATAVCAQAAHHSVKRVSSVQHAPPGIPGRLDPIHPRATTALLAPPVLNIPLSWRLAQHASGAAQQSRSPSRPLRPPLYPARSHRAARATGSRSSDPIRRAVHHAKQRRALCRRSVHQESVHGPLVRAAAAPSSPSRRRLTS